MKLSIEDIEFICLISIIAVAILTKSIFVLSGGSV